jgi:threonine efflux protein
MAHTSDFVKKVKGAVVTRWDKEIQTTKAPPEFPAKEVAHIQKRLHKFAPQISTGFHMTQMTLLLSVATLWALAVVSPGPNFLMTARLAIARSRRAGLEAVTGIALGTICWAAAGCLGVRALFIAAPWMYLLIKTTGAAYLVFVGGQLLWSSWRRKDDFAPRLPERRPRVSPFQLGLLTTLANPRSAVSVASIFATAMPSHPSLMLSASVMAVMVAISVCWYALIACLFAAPTLADGYQRFRRWIDRLAGACLVLFGAKLAVEP